MEKVRKMSHTFTVITPAYNAERFISKAMESVISQTEKDYEYIVVDNGSEDTTVEIAEEIARTHPDIDIKIISIKPNQGISGGRNAGIEKASGKYVCLLDADDWWYPNKLEEVKKVILKYPEYGVIGHWENQVEGEKIVRVGRFRSIDNKDAFRDLLFNGDCLSPSATVVRTDILRKHNGFDIRLDRGQEDFDCWLRLAHDGAKFYMIREALSVWLIRNDSLSARRKYHTDAVVSMLESHFSVLGNESGDKERVKRKKQYVYARNYCGCAHGTAKNGDFRDALAIYRKSLGHCRTYWKSYVGIALCLLHVRI